MRLMVMVIQMMAMLKAQSGRRNGELVPVETEKEAEEDDDKEEEGEISAACWRQSVSLHVSGLFCSALVVVVVVVAFC